MFQKLLMAGAVTLGVGAVDLIGTNGRPIVGANEAQAQRIYIGRNYNRGRQFDRRFQDRRYYGGYHNFNRHQSFHRGRFNNFYGNRGYYGGRHFNGGRRFNRGNAFYYRGNNFSFGFRY
ncbi:hypothetical protein [Stratiformator vulcanicus]|nr:hypothetical protein [Stratiformator vulcanicus]